jgi:hypothetical protein
MPDRVVEPDLRHVAEDSGIGRNQAQGVKGIGKVVVGTAAEIETAGLFPETMDIGLGIALAGMRLSMIGRLVSFRLGFVAESPIGFSVISMISSKPRRTTRMLSSTTRAPLLPNFFLDLVADGLEERLLGQVGVGHEDGAGEESALEGDTLHPELEFHRMLLHARS